MGQTNAVAIAIEADPGLAALRDRVAAALDGDAAHDLTHSLRVAHWTLRLGAEEVVPREAIAAALLHDFVNLPKDSPQRGAASVRSASAARELLPDCGFDGEAADRIADAIRDHSFSRGAEPESPLGRALQDADRLEALGAIGILRTLAIGTAMGAELFHPSDPWAESRELNDRRYTLDHFEAKLLGLSETLLTPAGRAEARRRLEIMQRFLDALAGELGTPRPSHAGRK